MHQRTMGELLRLLIGSVPVIVVGACVARLIGYRIRPIVIRGDGGEVHWIYRPEFVDPAAEGRPILDRIWQAQDRLAER